MSYALVHVVAGESTKDLVETQVIAHMREQAMTAGRGAPRTVHVVFLEPLRVALQSSYRARIRELQRRTPQVTIHTWALIGRLGLAGNARQLAMRLRWAVPGLPTVLHCRGEAAVAWAEAIQRHLPGLAIVADIRGSNPDEALSRRGFDGPEQADEESLVMYQQQQRRLHDSLRAADAVMCVSDAMREWLGELGADGQALLSVPCCVPRVTVDAQTRDEVRAKLGLDGRLVLSYLGSITRYQSLEEGALAFVQEAMEQDPTVAFLALTDAPERMQMLLSERGIATKNTRVIRVPQREVARYLQAADAGLLLRADSRVNRVSMPVKLGEYLSSGVPVIVSRVPGWVDQIVDAGGAGIAVDWFGVDPQSRQDEARRALGRLKKDGAALRAASIALCESRFRWSTYVPAVRRLYARALLNRSQRIPDMAGHRS